MSFFDLEGYIDKKDSYFAAANTKNGFVLYFNEIFGEIPKIYAIKGGPGTGKSTLMQKIAAEAENRGHKVQRFFCSSDSSSLDGVVVGEKFAVIDATAPHVFEPRNIGAIDELINVCDMWQADKIASKKAEICALTKKISQKYSSVYRYLNTIATLEDEYFSTLEQYINKDKLKKFTDKISSLASVGNTPKLMLCDAIGTRGRVHTSSLENGVKKVIYLGGRYHEGEILLKYLKASLDSIGAFYEYSLSPESLYPCAIKIGQEITFVCIGKPSPSTKIQSTQKYLLQIPKEEKQRLRSIERVCFELCAFALNDLKAIQILHDELEEHYKDAMDYNKLDRFTKKLLIKMFC